MMINNQVQIDALVRERQKDGSTVVCGATLLLSGEGQTLEIGNLFIDFRVHNPLKETERAELERLRERAHTWNRRRDEVKETFGFIDWEDVDA